MAIFWIDIHPGKVTDLIQELQENGVRVQSNTHSITVRVQSGQMSVVEEICRKHSVELLNGLPDERVEAMTNSGLEADVLAIKEHSEAFRKE